LTHREEDKRVRRGKDAAKGATVIFWRLGGGDEEELLALRVLRLELEAIKRLPPRTLCRCPLKTKAETRAVMSSEGKYDDDSSASSKYDDTELEEDASEAFDACDLATTIADLFAGKAMSC